jgi:hypothetical protein
VLDFVVFLFEPRDELLVLVIVNVRDGLDGVAMSGIVGIREGVTIDRSGLIISGLA